MTEPLEVHLVNDIAEIARLADRVDHFFAAHDLPVTMAFHFNLALDELLTNIISYAFPNGGRHDIAVRLAFEAGTVTAELSDDGLAFDPLVDARPPVLTGSAEERPIGGFGVHFVKTMMDEVRYERRADRNRLILIKRAP